MEKNKTKTRNLFITKLLWQSSEILPLFVPAFEMQ